MNEKHLILKGCAGLGNRLYTLCSAIEYAQKTDRTLLVDWTDGQFAPEGVNAFQKCFDLKEVRAIKSWSEIKNLQGRTSLPKFWKENMDQGVYDLYVQLNSKHLKKIPRKLVPKSRFRKTYGYC